MRHLENPRVRTVFDFMIDLHSDQRHSGLPYEEGHLLVVAGIYDAAGLNSVDDFLIALCHDGIDDCAHPRKEETLDFIRHHLSDFSFRVVMAMSAVGKTRRERNADWMARIEAFPPAADYKVGDRIVNIEALGKRDMYLREDAEFSARIVSLCRNDYLIERYARARAPIEKIKMPMGR